MRPRPRTTTATAAALTAAVLAVTAAGCGTAPETGPDARPSSVIKTARAAGVLDQPGRDIHRLAHRAAARLDLHPPILTAAPAVDRHTPAGAPMAWVGEPVTLHATTPAGPVKASITTPYVTVTVTATKPRTTITTGDGTTLACRPAGTPCRHTYRASSLGQPSGAYPVTASTRWRVTYTASSGHTGPVDLPPLTTTTRLRVEAWRHTDDL